MTHTRCDPGGNGGHIKHVEEEKGGGGYVISANAQTKARNRPLSQCGVSRGHSLFYLLLSASAVGQHTPLWPLFVKGGPV